MPARPAASTAASPKTSATAQAPEFARKVFAGGFPNADSAYLFAVVTPPANGDVLVIRGKAPTAPRASHPSPWPAPFIDLRYWSLCNYPITGALPLVANPLPGGKIDYGCRYDSQVAADRHGYYTLVVGTEAQRPVIERIPGATFLPFSTADPTTPHLLLLRNTLANPGFAQAIQNVPQSGSPASAAAAMACTTRAPPSARSQPWSAAAPVPAWRARRDHTGSCSLLWTNYSANPASCQSPGGGTEQTIVGADTAVPSAAAAGWASGTAQPLTHCDRSQPTYRAAAQHHQF